jgi:hypothetical protein
MIEFLASLHGVRERGTDHWIARCPGPLHEHADRHPSLAIARSKDRWLIHCYSGCSPIDILQAIGLRLADLYDDHDYRPRGDRERPRLSASERLELLDHEIGVAFYVITAFVLTKTISDSDHQRLAAALNRIETARHG